MTRLPETRVFLDDGEIIVDSFAGGGGASVGIELALGRSPDIAINHDAEAIALHAANHPGTQHYNEDVWKVDPREAVAGRRVGLMWLSPDCKHFSKAKGGKPVSPRVRGLAWVAVRWAKAVKPRIIVLENVEEFQTWGPLKDDRPDPARKGRTFKMFVGRLRGLGYTVEWRELRACDYGAPTIRKRLFLVARCDGQPIVWPKPTHGKHASQKWRTAAECIDFSLPCPSIFGRKKDLAVNTQKRIAAGLKRFVFEADKPFIVNMSHSGSVESLGSPMTTIKTEKGGCRAIVQPVLAPMMVHTAHGEQDASGKKRGRGERDINEPMPTTLATGNMAFVAPVLVPRYGEREGQQPRAQSVEKPLSTIVPTQNGAGLCAAFLAKHQSERHANEVQAASLFDCVPTVKARDSHALVTSNLVQFNNNCDARSLDDVMPTVMGRDKLAEVRAFLVAYYGNEKDGGDLFSPMRTVTSKERFGLVTVEGVEYALVDIGMRMLAPRELYRAQGFPESYRIEIPFTNPVTGKTAPMSKTAQVRMCGNSVVPQVAAAIVAANVRKPADLREVA